MADRSSGAKRLTKEEKWVVAFAVAAWVAGFVLVFGVLGF